MPGINRTGKPTPTDYNLGRGALYFAELDAVTKKAQGYRHLGNCTAFALNLESETIEHQSSRKGLKQVDKEVIISQKAGISLTLDELNFQNVSLFLSGNALKDQTNPARTATITDLRITKDGKKGFWYDLTSLIDMGGSRLYDLATGGGILVVKTQGADENTAGAALTLNTDYEVDYKFGRIFIPSTSAHVEDQSLFFSYTGQTTEQLLDVVQILKQTKIAGALKFVAINPANSDKQTELNLFSVTLKAEGDMNLIGDEFTEMTLTGTAEANETGYPTTPVGILTTHADA